MRVRDLGPLLVETDGAAHPLPGAKQVALLSILVINANRRVSIETLISGAWGPDAQVSTSTVENQIWRLRSALGLSRTADATPSLVNESGGYRLSIAEPAVDSLRFAALAEQARHAAATGEFAAALDSCDDALQLWRGPAYATLTDPGITEPVTARLAEVHGQLSELRIDALLATGDTERALPDLEILTAEYPFRERLWAQRMIALSRVGRPEEALNTFRRARTILLEELGLEPGAELRELQRAIIARDLSVSPAPRPLPTTPATPAAPTGAAPTVRTAGAARAARPAIVGRDRELAVLSAARSNDQPGVVIAGAPGLGKSRLASEALLDWEASGACVVRARGTRSAAAIPLGAFSDVIPPQAHSDNLLTLLQLSARELREQAAGRPLVIGVDDAQLLDSVSATLVLHMATSGGAFVLATVRTGQPCPDAISSLWKDAGAERLDLTELSEAACAELVESILGGPLERSGQQWLCATSLGNALYLQQLTDACRSGGQLSQVDGLWRLDHRPPVPATLRELITATVDDLGETTRTALELVALAEPLPLVELLNLSHLAAVTTLESRGLISLTDATDASPVRIGHPLFGEVIRAELPPLRARLLREQLITAFAARADLDPRDLLRLTRWQLDAGQSPSVPQLIAAAQTANLASDPVLAAEFAARAKQAGADLEADLLLARARTIQRRYPEAETLLLAAEPNLRTREQAARYLEQQSEVLHWGLQNPTALRALLDRAQRWWPEPEWQEQIAPLQRRVMSFEHLGALAASTTANGQRTTAAGDEGSGPTQLLDVSEIANLFYAGYTDAARHVALAARPRLPLRDLDDAITLSLYSRISLETGEDWRDLDTWMSELLEHAVRIGDPAAAGQAAYSLAGLSLAAGRYTTTLTHLAEAERQLERHDPVGLLPVVAAMRVTAHHFSGDTSSVRDALRHCHDLLADAPPLAHQLPYVRRAEAWALYGGGDHAGAQRLLLETAQQLAPSPVHVARSTYEAMRAGAPAQTVAETLQLMAQRCDARLVRLYAAHATAAGQDDAAGLLATSHDLNRLGALRYAAEAAADAAAVHARREDRSAALSAAQLSRSLIPISHGAIEPPPLRNIV